ncbi:MAG: hypothetical protein C0402_09920 [Thermodesulfovibrio sp.]|nr:hypothetical protein [Thermodesulfovibrio sp.]
MDTSEVRDFIKGLESLSTIPVVLKGVLDITGNPDSSPEDLYKIISYDQTLAARVIRMANAPFFGHAGRVADIEQAVMFLGYENIRNMCIGMGVFMMFSKKNDRNLKQFWVHCYEVANTAGLIAEATTMVKASTAFLAGLLHDIGRLIFFSLDFQQYRAILGTDDLLEKETELFGCDHALAGSWFAEKAKLPEEIVLSVQYHHAPSRATSYQDIVSVVAISEALSRRFSPKIEDDGIWTPEHDAILLELSLTGEDLMDIEQRLRAEQVEINNFLDLK